MVQTAQKLLKQYYGYDEFRPGQEKVINSLLAGKDTLAIMPTGAGKSLCFQIPAMLMPGVTLVISPLISLMKDQVDGLDNQGVPATYINSSLSNAEVRQRLQDIAAGRYKLVYVAPERLDTDAFKAVLEHTSVSMLAVDEAHCVSQWGHDFRPSYQAVSPFINRLSNRPIIAAFTATATPEVKTDIVKLLSLKRPDVHVTGFDRQNLSFRVLRGENKQKFVLQYVKSNARDSGIIYAATRKEVDGLYEILRKKGYAAGRYHAGLSDEERIHQQERFIYDDIRVMVATNAFGMGIDKSNVRYVVHYNMPRNMEAYYQEAGRGGRDGEPAECILLYGAQDTLLQRFLIDKSVEHPERKQHELRKLQEMVEYCHTPECLRQFVLHYFGEVTAPGNCGNCGNCNDGAEMTDITIDAQKVFSCIYRMRERFGITLVAETLKGSKNKKVLQLGLAQLQTYGLFADRSLDDIKTLIQRLIATGYLQLSDGDYPVVKLAPPSIPVLKNLDKVWQKTFVQRERTSDDTLFEMLRKLRKKIAERDAVPPYVIFADSTLKEMSKYCPADEAGLEKVKGVGERKLQKYGSQFLEVIRAYMIANPSEAQAEYKAKPAPKAKEQSHLITLEMYRQGSDLEDIVKERGLTLSTVQNHLVRCSQEGYDVDWDRLIPAAYEEMIVNVIQEVGTKNLKSIKDSLPNEIGYGAIKAVLGKHFNE